MVKKNVSLLVILLLVLHVLLTAIPVFAVGDVVNENFNNATVGQAPTGWTVNEADSVSAVIAADPDDSGNKCVKITDENAGSSATVTKKFTSQTEPVIFEWRFREDDVNAWSRYQIRNGETIGVELVTTTTDGEVVLNIINDYGHVIKVMPVQNNTWYAVKVVVDPAAQKYDLYVDGELAMSGIPFSRDVKSLDNMIFLTGISYKNTMYIDDVRITNEEAALTTSSSVPYVAPAMNLPEIQDASVSNPDIDKEHEITYENFKGITWGMAVNTWDDGNGGYYQAGIDSDIEQMQYAGAHWIRIGFENATIGDGYEKADQIVEAVKQSGMKPIALYKKKYAEKTYGTEAEERQNAEHVKELVTRYKDTIKHWVIGNEPNLDGENWDLGGNEGRGTDDPNAPYNIGVKKYVQFLKNTYEAIKEADPEAVVIMSGISASGGWDIFMDRVAYEGGYQYFDEVAFHPYARVPEEVIESFNSFKEKVRSWPEPYNNKPIWVTEIGWHSESSWAPLAQMDAWNEDVKAGYLLLGMQGLYDAMDIKRPVFWYTSHESSRSLGFGLFQTYREDNGNIFLRQLPALEAMRSLNDHGTAAVVPPVDNPDVSDDGTIAIMIDGERLPIADQPPIMENDRVLVPMRAIFEQLGATIEWDEATSTVTASTVSATVSLQIDNTTAMKNGEAVLLDVPAKLVNGRTMVPIRFVAESLGVRVEWLGETQTVEITTGE